MILAARYAREHGIPYLGICLGMQVAVIEYARNAAGISDACSGEFHDASDHKVIDFLPGQSDEIDKGGTLRLGSYPCCIVPGTLMEKCYGKIQIPGEMKIGRMIYVVEEDLWASSPIGNV